MISAIIADTALIESATVTINTLTISGKQVTLVYSGNSKTRC
jgi:hypothetical protein